ncbi:MAG: leucine--tRNA ligase [Planctomycetota bacterium]
MNAPAPESKPHAYDFAALEAKWQAHWEAENTFAVPNPGDAGFNADRPKFYVLAMFPYPSGAGMHMGHALNYTSTDIPARYQRMRGKNVLHPIGYDAFGLPAEQYAVETGTHPAVTTQKNIDHITHQFKKLGIGFDWPRELSTTDPDYYRWTQWVFLKLYESYFDPIENKALPIDQLVAKLQGEDYYVGIDGQLVYSGIAEDLDAITGGPLTARKWHSLDADQQSRLLDEYRLAYMADVEVNWCPGLGTVLANEEVTNEGRSERGNFPVVKRPLKQWMLRITAYNDRLIDDLDLVDWPEPVKLLQRNWIGKSRGAQVDFAVDGSDEKITVFTTRPDTLFGATYMVLAPEHELVDVLTTDAQRDAVDAYRKQAGEKTSVERQQDAKEKTGVFTGAYAINPVNDEKIPVWIADYVMTGYGTGAIMAVPAHDERDFAFATKFGIPIVEVISGGDVTRAAFTGNGELANSSHGGLTLDGLDVPAAKEHIIAWLETHGHGKATTNYKLRDWLFSRQRYWGEPFPILHGPNDEIVALDESELPVELPEMEDFKPTAMDDPDAPPRPPLGRAPDSWRVVERDGVRYTRELNTMPQWAGSCWYYLRFCDAGNDQTFVGRDAEKYWMVSEKSSGGHHAGGVDLYVGGVEHAVLHLLYARFWHKVLYDLGHVSTPEPFGKLFNQGYIQEDAFKDERGIYVDAFAVVDEHGTPAMQLDRRQRAESSFFVDGKPVQRVFGKMGKSLKNSVTPDEVIAQYGSDTLRLFLMYLGPLDQSKPWNQQDIVGVHRFLNRLWRNFVDEDTGQLRVTRDNPSDELLRLTHRTIQRVTDAMEGMQFNVAIAALIELNNALVSIDEVPHSVALAIVPMLAPLAPHIAEELWEKLGHVAPHTSVADAEWPEYRPELLVSDTVELPVQVNGKLRGKVTVPADADQADIEEAAKAEENVALHLQGKAIRKVIVIPKKLVNLVVG